MIFPNHRVNPKQYHSLWSKIDEIVKQESHCHQFLLAVNGLQQSKDVKKYAKAIYNKYIKNVSIN